MNCSSVSHQGSKSTPKGYIEIEMTFLRHSFTRSLSHGILPRGLSCCTGTAKTQRTHTQTRNKSHCSHSRLIHAMSAESRSKYGGFILFLGTTSVHPRHHFPACARMSSALYVAHLRGLAAAVARMKLFDIYYTVLDGTVSTEWKMLRY